jgi:hypothetical protein
MVVTTILVDFGSTGQGRYEVIPSVYCTIYIYTVYWILIKLYYVLYQDV